jgi:adenylate cyclase
VSAIERREVLLDFIDDKPVKTDSDTPILQASLSAGINHTHICGGRMRCSTCRVLVSEGLENIRPRNAREARLAAIKGFSPDVRLACQSTATGDVQLKRLVLDDDDISQAIHEGRAGINVVGREIDATILFADIRSFTAFSEKSLPYDIVHILNRYFDAIGGAIDSYGGYIDKYMGDGIMAIFGLEHGHDEHHAILAMRSAKAMLEAVKEFNVYLKKRYSHEFRIGIGIHTAPAIVGELGFRKKTEFTAIGDTVNTASRIESLNKLAGTTALVSEATYLLVKYKFKWRKGYTAPVKGKELPVKVFEPDFEA